MHGKSTGSLIKKEILAMHQCESQVKYILYITNLNDIGMNTSLLMDYITTTNNIPLIL